jgi:hypothetical protein
MNVAFSGENAAIYKFCHTPVTFILGVCNPRGENASYNGLYFTQEELEGMNNGRSMNNVPVKTEHGGVDIGSVVSTFIDETGALQCLMEVDESSVSGALACGFVRDGIAADLSLGYSVDVKHHRSENKLKAGEKKVMEVSLVRKGARKGCHITAWDAGKGTFFKPNLNGKRKYHNAKNTCWDFFDLK